MGKIVLFHEILFLKCLYLIHLELELLKVLEDSQLIDLSKKSRHHIEIKKFSWLPLWRYFTSQKWRNLYTGEKIISIWHDITAVCHVVVTNFSATWYNILEIVVCGLFCGMNQRISKNQIGNWAHSLHSSEIRGLCLMKWPSEMLQNLPYFLGYENLLSFFIFHFALLYFFPNECPGQCRNRPGHSLGKK